MSAQIHKPGELDSHDIYITTMSKRHISFSDLQKGWKGDSRSLDQFAVRFVQYNKKSFDFLNLQVYLSDDKPGCITFMANQLVGCAPLYSPVNGKPYANIVIRGKFNEDVSEVIPLIHDDLEIQFDNTLKLPHHTTIQPPIYIECAKYIDKYIQAMHYRWRKFENRVMVQSTPNASTLWDRYAQNSYDPANALRFENKNNFLSTNHFEWRQLTYVLNLCIDIFKSSSVPRVSKRAMQSSILLLQQHNNNLQSVHCDQLRIHTADPVLIKELKTIGNRILQSYSIEYRAWNLNFNRLFEAYVQYLFGRLAERIKGKCICNVHYSRSGNRTDWDLAYLEPDAIIQLPNSKQLVIDAKYKTNIFNRYVDKKERSELHDEFRKDLHQVLCYSAFNNNTFKNMFIVYPNNRFTYFKQQFSSGFQPVRCNVYLVGIPWGQCYLYTNDQKTDSILTLNQKVEQSIDELEKIYMTNIIESERFYGQDYPHHPSK